MMDIVKRLMNRHCCQDNIDQEAAKEIERLREALQEYCDGQYSGYVTLPCGWDDAGTLAKFVLEGKTLQDYINDCKHLAEKE